MAGQRRRLVAGGIALALALGAGWLLARRAPAARRPTGAAAAPADRTARAAPDGPAALAASASTRGSPGTSGAALPRPAPPRDPLASPAPLEDGPDGESWRNARVAFKPRELGRIGASVKVALDEARAQMDFCFRDAGRAPAGGEQPQPDAGARPPDPATLVLYLQTREGALDVIEARADYLGDATPELVACCREVLRGLEISAFDAVPGQRYRLKLTLE